MTARSENVESIKISNLRKHATEHKKTLEIIFDVNQIFETVNLRNSGRLAGVY